MNNKIGIYYAFWEQEWHADYRKYVEKVSRLGFDVLEIAAGALPDMTREQRQNLAQMARDAGIELTFCIGLPAQYDMASEDPAVRQAGMQYAKKLLECVHEMGGKVLGGILYSSWPARMDFGLLDKRPWWDRSVQCVQKVAQIANDYGIHYCLEIVNRYEQFLINTVDEGLRYLSDVGNPACKLLLDVFHMNIEEDSIAQAIETAGDAIGHFHIGETNRRVPGRGRMPWDEIVDALARAGYTGRIVMEPFLRMGGTVGKDIKVWRDLSGAADEAWLDREAQFALHFMRDKLSQKG